MIKHYLKSNRLADVIALIQVLSFDDNTHRSINGLASELQGNPKSGSTWAVIAEEHPEFFRFNRDKNKNEGANSNTISLIARHVITRNQSGIREFSPDFAQKLIETAIQLHDKQKERADRWKIWLPLLVAIITVLSSAYVQYSSNQNQRNIKQYELHLKPKQEGYSNYMGAISNSYSNALINDLSLIKKSLTDADKSFYTFEPFLTLKTRDSVWARYQNYITFCYSVAYLNKDTIQARLRHITESYVQQQKYFRETLYGELFK
jgi:hypothetical protein